MNQSYNSSLIIKIHKYCIKQDTEEKFSEMEHNEKIVAKTLTNHPSIV